MAVIMPRSAMIHIPKTGGTWCRAAIVAAELPHFESGPAGESKLNQSHASLTQALPTIMMANWRENNMTPRKRFTFSFVRHPCAWLESTWADALEHGKLPGYAAKTEADIRFWRHCNALANNVVPTYNPSRPGEEKFWFHYCHAASFTDFIDNVLRIKPNAPSCAMLAAVGYEQDSKGTWRRQGPVIDFLGKNETLVSDFIYALKTAGEKFNERLVRRVTPKRVAGRLKKYADKLIWRPDQRAALYKANKQLFDKFGYDPKGER